MAPIGESCYFPPLDKCLDGRHQLLSWRTTFIGLTQHAKRADDGALKKHLMDVQTIELLSKPFSPFSAPTSKTKASFETRTSAINVSPSSQGRYDIGQIKDDALWLSEKASIDEVAALRITILEWQTRPANRLLMSDAYDDYQDQHNTAGINGLKSSILKSGPSLLAGRSPQKGEDVNLFEDSKGRHQRLLRIFLSEGQYLIRTCEYIIFGALFDTFPQPSDNVSDQLQGKSPDRLEWLARIGDQILVAWNLDNVTQDSGKHFTVDAVDALRVRCQALWRGAPWLPDEPGCEQIDQASEKNRLLEIIHIMQLLLTLILSSTKLTRSDTVLAWFRIMDEYGFLNNLELSLFSPQDTYILTLESLVALISLAVLKLPAATESIEQISIGALPVKVSVPYLLDIDGICEINGILVEAAAACLTNSSPAVLAWSIILQRMRECSFTSKEAGLVGKSMAAAGNYAMENSSGSDTHGKRSRTGRSESRRLGASNETSPQPGFLEEVLDNLMDAESADDPIKDLARSALDGSNVLLFITALAIDYCSVFASNHQGTLGLVTRRMLLDLLRATFDWIDYQPTLINAVLAVLTGNLPYWNILDRPSGFIDTEPATYFLSDTILMQKLFYTSLARFPYESLPFLRVSKALALAQGKSDEGLPEIFLLMQNVNSLTSMMPPEFSAYELVQDDEDSNYIQLTSNMDLFDDYSNVPLHTADPTSTSRMVMTSTWSWDSQQLPSGTLGHVISESKPLVVMWRYNYAPLKYLGRILQSASMDGNFSEGSSEVVSETIDLLTIMMSANSQHDSEGQSHHISQEAARQILEHASDGLNRNQDIVSVIFQIFENELYRRQILSGDEPTFDTLLRCVQFIHALLTVMPDRVWPFLARSSLLGVGSVESQFNTLVASSEIIPGYYGFLFGCIRLFDALIEDTIRRTTSQSVASTAMTRLGLSASQESGVSRIMMEKVLHNYQQMMMNMLDSQQSRKLASQREHFEINHWICSAFVKILNFCYAIDDQADSSHKIAGPLTSAAEALVDAFRSAFNSGFKIHALLQILLQGMASADTSLSIQIMQYLNSQTISAISLITTLIRVNKLLGRAPQRLDEDIFKASPILVKLYATNEEIRFAIVDLFEAVISSAATVEQQPPSLLGHLNEVPARSFLEMLSLIDQPFENVDLSIGIWRLLSTIVSQRQQWFAIFVLTGNTPRESLKDTKDTAPNATILQPTEPLLAVALDRLSNLEKLTPSITIAMLEFIVLAADFWPWVVNTIEEHPHFLGAIREFLAAGEENLQDRTQKASMDYMRLRIASLIVNIFAMFISYTPKVGDSAHAKKLIPNLSYLSEVALSMPSYNASLHGYLRRNFELKFPGLQISQFKRSSLKRPMLGSSFYYDMELATKVLSFDSFWNGRRRGRGFADELLRANINLSLVESQVNLLQAWKFLSVELSQPLGSDEGYQKVMISTVIACLRSNVSSKLPENIFQGLALSRAELAFSLLQRLYEVKSNQYELENVLSAAWDTLRDYERDVGLALSGANADYYRILLKILSLSLQSYLLVSSSPSRKRHGFEQEGENGSPNYSAFAAATQTAVEIFGVVVLQGFRSLTTLLHDDPTRSSPADFALIIAISRAILHMPSIGNNIAQLLSQFSDNQTTLYASALLSWSDQITTHHDPVYAELSIFFLLSLSDVPSMAECLAVEGLLTQLSSTNLISCLRQKTGVGPFDNPSRLYSIWYRGILPLLLNLLTAIGAPIASEIACTLNSFPAQLSRASNTFGSKSVSSKDPTAGSITLSMAIETQNLAMIRRILGSFREAGPSAGVDADHIVELTWDQTQVKDDIEHWMQRRAALRSRIVPTNEKEKTWAWLPPLSTTNDAEHRLEEKVLEEMEAILRLLDDNDQ